MTIKCSYCSIGLLPNLYSFGWGHTSAMHTEDEYLNEGSRRIIVCIDKHPEVAENWKDMQLTSEISKTNK